MTTFNAREVAEAYNRLSEIDPPEANLGTYFTVNDLVLLRSVDPQQHELLSAICRKNPRSAEWELVRRGVLAQREIRAELYSWVSRLHAEWRRSRSDFVFPDPFSLLVWIWTMQLFQQSYVRRPGKRAPKYFYRGEHQDYGRTQFLAKAARDDFSSYQRDDGVPLRIRNLLRQQVPTRQQQSTLAPGEALVPYLIRTMSCAQALAVAQHYGYPTPLLDVTTHPEVALFFATLTGDADVGVVGYWDSNPKSSSVARSLAPVFAPPVFTRIRRQSGYFLCSPPGNAASPLKPLRFHHRAEVEPLLPTWLVSLGALGGKCNPKILLDDPYDLEVQCRRELPDPLEPLMFGAPRKLSESESSELLRHAVVDFVSAAGRSGVLNDGRRFSEIHPGLVYSVLRHAPVHGWLYAVALTAAAETQMTALEPVSRIVVGVMHSVVSGALTSSLGHRSAGEIVFRSTADFLKVCWRIVSGDPDVLGWPLNSWYAPSAR